MESPSGGCGRRRRQVKDEAGMDCGITTAEFHPDGIILGTGCQDTVVRVWEARQQKVPPPLPPPPARPPASHPVTRAPSSQTECVMWGYDHRSVGRLHPPGMLMHAYVRLCSPGEKADTSAARPLLRRMDFAFCHCGGCERLGFRFAHSRPAHPLRASRRPARLPDPALEGRALPARSEHGAVKQPCCVGLGDGAAAAPARGVVQPAGHSAAAEVLPPHCQPHMSMPMPFGGVRFTAHGMQRAGMSGSQPRPWHVIELAMLVCPNG